MFVYFLRILMNEMEVIFFLFPVKFISNELVLNSALCSSRGEIMSPLSIISFQGRVFSR